MRLPQDDQAPVTRLYERLTEALQRTRRDPFNVPVTVAEVYQELVPYRLVRTEIGFDMNADYEHALLRLLAGEGEWVRIEPAHAAEEIRRELRSANPNLSLYRDYAACDVWVRKPLAGGALRPGPTAAAPAAVQPPTPRVSEPASAARAAAARATPEQKPAARAPAEPGPPPPPPARPARPGVASPAAEQRQASRAGTEPPPGQQQPPEEREQVADWQVPVELKDITLTGEAPDAAVVETFKLAGDDRPDREEKDDERAVAVTPMSDTPKREAATAEESAGTPPSGKAARSASTTRSSTSGRTTPAATAAPKAGAQAAKPEAARCAFCDSQLPQQRPARFCPYCGADQTTRPCPSCGEPVEPGWAFCITCGATAQ